MGKSTFVVGRRLGGGTVMVFVGTQRGPITGPWTLRAVVSVN
jgi:hypothetical protein